MGLDENDLLLVDLVDNPGLPEGENCYFQQYDGEYISSNVSKCQIHLQLTIKSCFRMNIVIRLTIHQQKKEFILPAEKIQHAVNYQNSYRIL